MSDGRKDAVKTPRGKEDRIKAYWLSRMNFSRSSSVSGVSVILDMVSTPLKQIEPGNKRHKPTVPSSLDILSDRRPAKQMLYDPLRYGVLSSDDPYSVDVSIIIPLFILSSSLRRKDCVKAIP